jgi:L-ribulokinase
VGDHFAWVAEHITPESYRQEARQRGMDIQQYLTELAQKQKPGAHGLVALDWWNGCRSILMDSNLTGMIMGMTLNTRAEDIYRALIEATAFDTKVLLDAYEANGIYTDSIFVSGGISRKNPMMMQIYADVLNRPLNVVSTTQGGALGSAIVAAAASGVYSTPEEAVKAMASPVDRVYNPIAESVAVYKTLYGVYKTLHDKFGGEDKHLIQTLNNLRRA